MAKLLIQNGELPIGEIELNVGRNRLGRHPDNDFQIDHGSISGAHCEIVLQNGAVFVRDLGSTNGTYVDQGQVTESYVLSGQMLSLGSVHMILDNGCSQVAIPTVPVPEVRERTCMPDGSPCCVNHFDTSAYWQCIKCSEVYCSSCVSQLRVAGGKPHRFCPSCHAECQRLRPSSQRSDKKSFFGRILDAFTKTR